MHSSVGLVSVRLLSFALFINVFSCLEGSFEARKGRKGRGYWSKFEVRGKVTKKVQNRG